MDPWFTKSFYRDVKNSVREEANSNLLNANETIQKISINALRQTVQILSTFIWLRININSHQRT